MCRIQSELGAASSKLIRTVSRVNKLLVRDLLALRDSQGAMQGPLLEF